MYADRPQFAQSRQPQRRGLTLPSFISDAPALFGGAVVSLGVMGAIFVNAMWFQPGPHPGPMFTPRTADVAEVAPSANSGSVVVSETVAVTATPAQPAAAPSAASKEILREVQTALQSRGYYKGKLDGVYGSRTQAAIESFQRDHSMSPDGQATVRLLTQVLMSASAAPAEVPVPKEQVKTAKVNGGEIAALPADVADGMIARIQAGLRKYGYDDIVVDGHMGQQTATAIQRFQLDFGMKITGEPSQQVLEKLQEVGA